MTVLMIIVVGLLGAAKTADLIRKKYWKDMVVFLIFLVFGTTIAALQINNVKIPHPLRGLVFFVEEVLKIKNIYGP
ncbi:MAG TPA: hypothetical protein PLZ84_03360 [Clostridia bacterium]|nr:hypothetical protein [Clostridia bacterium]